MQHSRVRPFISAFLLLFLPLDPPTSQQVFELRYEFSFRVSVSVSADQGKIEKEKETDQETEVAHTAVSPIPFNLNLF